MDDSYTSGGDRKGNSVIHLALGIERRVICSTGETKMLTQNDPLLVGMGQDMLL